LQQKAGHRSGKCPGFSPDELRVAFSIPPGSLFLVNHPVLWKLQVGTNNITREVRITGALKFENCNINVTVGKKINEFMSDFFV
jgi:hypothetical protein